MGGDWKHFNPRKAGALADRPKGLLSNRDPVAVRCGCV
jgi:hypothetical protein